MLKKIVYYFNNLKIKPKLILSYICVVLLPVGIIGGILTSAIENRDVNQNISASNHHLEYVSMRIQEVLNVGDKSSINLYGDKDLISILTQKYTNSREIVRDYRAYDTINDFLSFYNEIDSIKVLTTNKTLLNNSIIVPVTDELKCDWYRKAMANLGKSIWAIPYNPKKKAYELNCIRCISNYKTKGFSVDAVLVITINNDSINQFLESEKYPTFLLNSDNYILSSSNSSIIGKKIKDICTFKKNQSEEFTKVIYNNKNCYLVDKTFKLEGDKTPITIVTIIPESNISHSAKIAKAFYTLLILAVITATILLIILFSEVFSKRIKKLNNSMNLIANGDLSLQVKVNGGDEISELARSMNFMVKEIKNMTFEIQAAELQKHELLINQKDMQFKFLASQINPHYLFNVLESVRMKALVNEQKEIAHVIKLIANQLRTSMSIENGAITISDELQFITNYVQIQTFRFGDKFKLIIDVQDRSLYNCSILPLIIQPLVENAVIHGLKEKQSDGIIKITIFKNEYGIYISVSDNGIGMNAEQIEHIKTSINEVNAKSRIGLKNIQQRVKLHWGNEYGLLIESKEGKGTTVTIRLP